MYAKHEELCAKLQGTLGEAHDYLVRVEDEITKLAHDLTVLSTHQDHLHRDRPRAHFSEAEAAIAALYNRYRRLRDRIVETIKYLDKVLQEASAKRFPGGIPRQGSGGEDPVSGRQGPKEADTRAGADRELEELFELDRRGHDGT
jgi:transposase